MCVVSKASLELLSRGVQLSVTGTKHSDMVFRKKDLSVHMQGYPDTHTHTHTHTQHKDTAI